MNTLGEQLEKIWGYREFRPPQKEIVQSILQQKDSMIIMPTGGGKSLCFQLPAILQSGLTLVISPLIALMENQVQELKNKGIKAGLLHSQLPKIDRQKILEQLQKQQLKLLYLSPETLLTNQVWEILIQPQLIINSIILDEAHCLSQWGDTFRPSYRRLGVVRESLLKSKPPNTKIAIASFTATADPNTQKTIQQVLKLSSPEIFRLDPYRENLSLSVERVFTPKGRQEKLLKFVTSQGNRSGLIYVRTRRETEELAAWLGKMTNQSPPVYHGGLSASQRRLVEEKWLTGTSPYVITTCAFGMGINKPNVRWIAHYQPPLLLSEYIQEIGRAGRDGLPAKALLLASEPTGWLDPSDRQRHQSFLRNNDKFYNQAKRLLNNLPDTDSISNYADQEIPLAILHRLGIIDWLTPLRFRRQNGIQKIDVTPLIREQERMSHQITSYLNTRDCRWKFLVNQLGFDRPDLRCYKCDRCTR